MTEFESTALPKRDDLCGKSEFPNPEKFMLRKQPLNISWKLHKGQPSAPELSGTQLKQNKQTMIWTIDQSSFNKHLCVDAHVSMTLTRSRSDKNWTLDNMISKQLRSSIFLHKVFKEKTSFCWNKYFPQI